MKHIRAISQTDGKAKVTIVTKGCADDKVSLGLFIQFKGIKANGYIKLCDVTKASSFLHDMWDVGKKVTRSSKVLVKAMKITNLVNLSIFLRNKKGWEGPFTSWDSLQYLFINQMLQVLLKDFLMNKWNRIGITKNW